MQSTARFFVGLCLHNKTARIGGVSDRRGFSMKISKEDQSRLKELIEVCKEKQGEYLEVHHGPGSWATTYSNEFISAAAEMYLIFEKSGSYWPISNLSRALQDAGVRSCRGSSMGIDRTEYLYKTHLKSKIDQIGKR